MATLFASSVSHLRVEAAILSSYLMACSIPCPGRCWSLRGTPPKTPSPLRGTPPNAHFVRWGEKRGEMNVMFPPPGAGRRWGRWPGGPEGVLGPRRTSEPPTPLRGTPPNAHFVRWGEKRGEKRLTLFAGGETNVMFPPPGAERRWGEVARRGPGRGERQSPPPPLRGTPPNAHFVRWGEKRRHLPQVSCAVYAWRTCVRHSNCLSREEEP
jgi:hypothetical protein